VSLLLLLLLLFVGIALSMFILQTFRLGVRLICDVTRSLAVETTHLHHHTSLSGTRTFNNDDDTDINDIPLYNANTNT